MNRFDKATPKVSIVIPVYNGSNYLKEAIDSAINQTYRNVEVIVVNDGSKDNGATERIALSYKEHIKYFEKENGGVAAALNLGIEKMTGDYFSWLSHDDLYEKTKIDDQINFLKTFNTNNIIVASNVYTLFENGIKKKEYIDKKTFEYFDIFLATSAYVGLNGCSLLIPKKALVDSGGFDTNLLVTQDYDLWFRLKNNYKFKLLDKHLVVSRRHDMQDSVQKIKFMLEAGDKLHYGFLKSISYERFEEYFYNDKANIKHTWNNYRIYKSRGYIKTASMILRNILKYFYKNDINKFYRTFQSEIVSNIKTDKRLSKNDYQVIDKEYAKIINNDDIIPIKIFVDHNDVGLNTGLYRRYTRSVKQDGLYLTGEKIIRKLYKIILLLIKKY